MFNRKDKKDNAGTTAVKDLIYSQKIDSEVKGNGHKKNADIPPVATETLSDQEEIPVMENKTKSKVKKQPVKETVISEAPFIPEKSETDMAGELQQIADIEEKEADKQIPGNGYLFNIKKKHLKEATVLDRGQVLSFAIGLMQENMLNTKRKDSIFVSLIEDIMHMNVSIGGLAREQVILARQQEAEKSATLNLGSDLMGKR